MGRIPGGLARVRDGLHLAFDYLERIDIVVAARRADFATLTVRTIAAHGHGEIADRIIASVEVLE